MGNSSATQAAAAAAAGGAIQARVQKEKKRAKKFACFCCWCNVAAIASIITGIVLLVFFASSLSKNYDAAKAGDIKQDTAKGVTYAGIALMLFGLLLMIIGVIFGIALWVAYKRISGKTSHKTFVPQKYAHGTAPYPQQDWGDHPNPHEPAASPVPPSQPGHGAVDTDAITPEIR